MNAGMKMMIANRSRGGNRGGGNRGGNQGGSGGRSEMEMRNRGEMNYGGMDNEAEARRRYRRDSRGRFRSEMEMGGMDDEMEMRRGYGGRNEMGYGGTEMRRGGGRGGSGGRNEMEDREEMRGGYGESEMRSEMRGYPNRPFPVYVGGGSNMNPIGFDPYREVETNYRMNATHKTGNEMEHKSGAKMGGGAMSDETPEITKELAEEWTSGMKNSDGTRGEHWTSAQTRQFMAQKGIECDPWEFYIVMNMLYSDYCAVLKKHGVNTVDVYADLACAWLKDTDAVPNKTAKYFENVVK